MKKGKALSVLVLSVLCLTLSGCKSSDYKEANEFQEAGDYEAALEIYEELGDYKDSAEKASECQEFIEAIATYEASAESAEAKNAEADAAVESAEALIAEGDPVLDETCITSLETAVSAVKAVIVDIGETPETVDEMLSEAAVLDAIDYTDVLNDLSEARENLENTIAQYALVDNPSEAYVISCLQTVEGIIDISAATEDNDPNGNLNKSGGYTAQVYFSYELVDQDSVSGTTVIEKGTDCGGSIEVYTTAEDAETREAYLAAFDGGIFASGSHTVIGTCLVRTSDELTATQQQELEAALIEALTSLD